MKMALFERDGRGVSSERSKRSNITKVLYFRALGHTMAAAIPHFKEFWGSYGMGPLDCMKLQAIFLAAELLLEIPSGHAADQWGRKPTLTIGAAALVAGGVSYYLAESFNGFILAELLLALGIAFNSGADEALLYDSLADGEPDDEAAKSALKSRFKKEWARVAVAESVVAFISFIAGGFIGSFNARWPLLLAVLGYLVMFLIALTLKEPVRHKKSAEAGHIKHLSAIVQRVLFENRTLAWVILFSSILAAYTQAAFWNYEPYFKAGGLQGVWIGVAYALLCLTQTVMALKAEKIESMLKKYLGEQAVLIAAALAIPIGFLAMGWIVTVWSGVFIVFHQFVRSMNGIVCSSQINAETDSSVRATTISIRGACSGLTGIGAMLLMGWVTESSGLISANLAAGCSALLLGGLLLLARPKVTN